MTPTLLADMAALVASWTTVSVLVSGSLLALALLVQQLVRGAVPQRLVWSVALAASAVLAATQPWRRATVHPAAIAMPPTPAAGTATEPAAGPSLLARARHTVRGVPALAAQVTVSASMATAGVLRTAPSPVQWFVVVVWPVATLVLFGIGAWSYRRQRRAVQRARQATIAGQPVLVTASVGPAVFGVRQPRIIVPAWLLTRTADEQRLVVQHEQAHIDAHDPLLLLGACALVALMPWNPAAWYMLSRLRLAIECDCDARVLQRGAAPRRYGALLIDLSAAARPLPPLTGAPAFSHRASHLERRLRRMTDRPTTYRVPRRLAGAAIATLAVAAACGAELPTSAELQGMDVAAAEKRAFVAAPDMSAARYVVDGKTVSEAEAKSIKAERIASIEISKVDRKRSEVRIATQAPTGVSVGAAESTAAPERVLVAVRADGTADTTRGLMLGDSVRMVPPKSMTDVLIFVDGVKATEAAMKMPPDRIERIEVIKGAAAEKLYGPEGAKGVIHITTKK